MPIIFKQLRFISCCWQTNNHRHLSIFINVWLENILKKNLKLHKFKFQCSSFKLHIQVSIFCEQITLFFRWICMLLKLCNFYPKLWRNRLRFSVPHYSWTTTSHIFQKDIWYPHENLRGFKIYKWLFQIPYFIQSTER